MAITDILAKAIGVAAQESMMDILRVESVETPYALTLKDGSLLSMVDVKGALQQLDEDGLADMLERLRIGISSYLSRPGHMVEINFMRDGSAARRQIERIVDRAKRASRNLDLDLDDVLDERVESVSRKMTAESCILSIYTRPSVASKDEAKQDVADVEKRMKGMPSAHGGQIHGKIADIIATRHEAMVEAFVNTLSGCGQIAELLSAEEALQEIRGGLYPETYAVREEWTPNMPVWAREKSAGKEVGLKLAPETPEQMAGFDISNLLTPGFDEQLATEDAYITDGRTVRIAGTQFEAFDMTFAPEVLPRFDDLVNDITAKGHDIPWRASARIESGGVASQALKSMIVGIFQWSSPTRNKRIAEAIGINREVDGRDDVVVRFRMSFSTWAPIEDARRLRRNSQILQGAVKRWGNTGVDGISGDPLSTVLSTVPGAIPGSTAPVAAGPLGETLAMMPFSRQASPWDTGSVLYRTPSGKPWPFQPGSSKQTTWITLLCGTPGSGKSVQLNAMNFASAIAVNAATSGGGKGMLPRIAIIDIGPSSSGVISLLREALPRDRRHEVEFIKLRMDPAMAINVFDTQIGMRKPLSAERIFLVNFLSLAISEGDKEPSGPMLGLISAAIDQAYANMADDVEPRRFNHNEVSVVDHALEEIGFETNHNTIWWEVVDVLAAAGKMKEAEIAQRFAVPTLSDLVTASQSDQIVALYGDVRMPETNELILDAFSRVISEVVRDYAILGSHTRFTLSNARIVAMDLSGVTAKGTSAAAKKQTAMMYMLARQVMARDFFLDGDEIRQMAAEDHLPEQYLAGHLERARMNLQLPKIICMDEFHRTGGQPSIINQLLQDGREGRKFNIDLKVASQLIEDFPPSLIEVASSLIVCNTGSERSIDYIDKMIGLNEHDKFVMRYHLNGPSSKGAPFWSFMKTKAHGNIRQELALTLGPVELWAFSTTAEDVALRTRLYDKLGPALARRVLAVRFPGGSVQNEIETRIARMEERGERYDQDEASDNIIDVLAEELIQQAYLLQSDDV